MEDSTSKEITWMDGGWWMGEITTWWKKYQVLLGDLFGRKNIHTNYPVKYGDYFRSHEIRIPSK